jgi:hypothetical protein
VRQTSGEKPEPLGFRRRGPRGWEICDEKGEVIKTTKVLDAELASLPIDVGLPVSTILERIRSGWSGSDDVDPDLGAFFRSMAKGSGRKPIFRDVSLFVEGPKSSSRELKKSLTQLGYVPEETASEENPDSALYVVHKLIDHNDDRTVFETIAAFEASVSDVVRGFGASVTGNEISLE